MTEFYSTIVKDSLEIASFSLLCAAQPGELTLLSNVAQSDLIRLTVIIVKVGQRLLKQGFCSVINLLQIRLLIASVGCFDHRLLDHVL